MNILGKIRRKILYYVETIRDLFRFQKQKNLIQKNCYVMISHNAHGAGGAPVVLFELAKLVKKNGHDVVFLSYEQGSLLESCEAAGIYGYMTGKLFKRYLRALFPGKPACFIANTMLCGDSVCFLLENNQDARVVWWVHEENKIVREKAIQLPQVSGNRFRLLCVSERVKAVAEESMPQLAEYMSVMYYGCEDLLQEPNAGRKRKKDTDKYTICSIGYISSRKNQLQLVEAVERLPKEIRDKVEVLFVYDSADNQYFQKMKAAIGDKPYFKLVGAVPRNKMADWYQNMDLLVCSSIDDPLPVVVTEAMMLKRPFITSSETGQYALVSNAVNGYVYNAADTQDLTQKIMLAYENKPDDALICQARKLYESTFSLQVLEKNFTNLIS